MASLQKNNNNSWTSEEYQEYIKTKKKPKYRNKKVTIDGIKFDSIRESEYYLELKVLKKAGIILDFELQPKFVLQEKFKKKNKTYSEIKYIADFKIFYPDGEIKIVDVKGFKTKEFLIKQKLFEYKFPEYDLILVE